MKRFCAVVLLLPMIAWSLEWKNTTDDVRERSAVFKSVSFKSKEGSVSVEFAMTKLVPKEEDDEFTAKYLYAPSVFMKDAKKTSRYLDLSETLRSFAWEDIFYFAEKELVFGVLEFSVEGPSDTLMLIRGDLKNKKWDEVKIPKPHYTAQFKSLEMNKDGSGTVVMEDQTGFACGTGKKYEGAESVLVEVKTKDYGKKWILPKNCTSARGNFLRTAEFQSDSKGMVKCEEYRNVFWGRTKESRKIPEDCRPR